MLLFVIKADSTVHRIQNKERRAASKALVAEIKQCGKTKDLQAGRRLHSAARNSGLHEDRYVAHALISMYGSCGRMNEAGHVFESMIQHDVVSWTTLMIGYVENGESLSALEIFERIDCQPDSFTFVAALKACAGLVSTDRKSALQKVTNIHREARLLGFEKHRFVANTLVDMYSKCGRMLEAQKSFDSLSKHDVVSWTALIAGYVENGESSIALDVFARMDCLPNNYTFAAALNACTALGELGKGTEIHKQVVESGAERDVFVANTLVDMYSKCRSMTVARKVFESMVQRDVVSWNSLILGYVENEDYVEALEVFGSMDCASNDYTFVAAIKACSGLATVDANLCLEKGLAIHKKAEEFGFDKDLFVANTLVDMYSKCKHMQEAREVFDSMLQRDVVSWTALILGYVENGESLVALELFARMDCTPDNVTFVAALKACTHTGSLELGRRIHSRVRELGLENDEMVGSCLVDFYAKSGDMTTAEDTFNKMQSRGIVSWSVLIGGYTALGDSAHVFRLVKKMEETGVYMDSVTFLLVLTACSHAGMVEEGQRYFESMPRYNVAPRLEHYTCMIDMLGRANRLQEALLLIESVPFETDGVIWRSLLGACRKWNNVEIGRIAFHALVTRASRLM